MILFIKISVWQTLLFLVLYFIFCVFFLYSAGLIILDSNIVSMYFHVFFAKVSCNRYSLKFKQFYVKSTVECAIIAQTLTKQFFYAHFWTVTHCNITGYGRKKKIIHIFRKFDSRHGVDAFMIYF